MKRIGMSTYRAAAVGCAVGAALWIAGAGASWATEATAVRPGDEAMTCEEIATELSAYAQQIVPNVQALGASQQQLYAQESEMGKKRRAEQALLTPLAAAGGLDPTGASKWAYQAALMAQMAKEKAENEALANSPLAKQTRTQSEHVAAQAQQMQSNARLQRLMQLGQAKHCDKR